MHPKQIFLLASALALPISASPLNTTLHRLAKRADPPLINFPEGSDDIGKLIGGKNDVYVLAAVAQGYRKTFPDIWNLYFPISQQDAAERVFNQIVPDIGDALTGGDTMALFRIDHIDWLAGTDNDICAGDGLEGVSGEGYTSNLVDDNGNAYARCHICEKALDDSEPDEPLRLKDIPCDAFLDEDDNYRITEEMNALASVMLHEMMHWNGVSGVAYRPDVPDLKNMDPNDSRNFDPAGALIWDIQKPPSSPKATRELTEESPVLSIKNVENYVWLALETYWTVTCRQDLIDNDQTRFLPPDE